MSEEDLQYISSTMERRDNGMADTVERLNTEELGDYELPYLATKVKVSQSSSRQLQSQETGPFVAGSSVEMESEGTLILEPKIIGIIGDI